MSLERQGEFYVATCDDCDEELLIVETDFYEALEAMRRENWRITKKGGEWHHECNTCQAPDADDFEDVS